MAERLGRTVDELLLTTTRQERVDWFAHFALQAEEQKEAFEKARGS